MIFFLKKLHFKSQKIYIYYTLPTKRLIDMYYFKKKTFFEYDLQFTHKNLVKKKKKHMM